MNCPILARPSPVMVEPEMCVKIRIQLIIREHNSDDHAHNDLPTCDLPLSSSRNISLRNRITSSSFLVIFSSSLQSLTLEGFVAIDPQMVDLK